MSSVKIGITIDRKILRRVDGAVSRKVFPTRSRAIQQAVAEKLARGERFAAECAKLDPKFEKALAKEGWGRELQTWPQYSPPLDSSEKWV